MSALLVKDTPPALNDWLKAEARLNRRSLGQQILVCLEWCMLTYGEAQFRNPFGVSPKAGTSARPTLPTGKELAKRLAARPPLDRETAEEMKRDAKSLRKSKERRFDYACFA